MSKILAVVPAYNEAACIERTIRELTASCPQIDYLVVNDGSKDATALICEQNKFNYLSLPINCGLTAGFQTGMKYAYRHNYDAVVQFDADGQHMPDYIMSMYECMCAQDADIVIGSRTGVDKPTGARGLGSRLISALIHLIAHISIQDPTPEPDALAYFARHGYTIKEVPVKMRERQGGQSYFDIGHIISYMSRTCMSIVLFQWFR